MGNLTKHFSREEFRCKCGCGRDSIDYQTLIVLEQVREHFGVPVVVTSGHRCAARNKAVGGAPNSQHLYGRAADIKVTGVKPRDVVAYLNSGPLRGTGGIGLYATFTHVDTRSGKATRW